MGSGEALLPRTHMCRTLAAGADKTQVPALKEVPKGSRSGFVGEKDLQRMLKENKVVESGGRKQLLSHLEKPPRFRDTQVES